MDDGSTDDSGLLCDKWALNDSRIKVIHQANQGVSIARNRGIEISIGEYIAFIDSDDWVDSSYLRDLYDNRNDCELVISGHIGERENGNNEYCEPLATKTFALSSENNVDFVHLNKKALLYGPVNKLFVAKIIKGNRILFPENCAYGEDLMFSYHYLEYVKKVATVKNMSYHYIMRDHTLSRRIREDQFDNDYHLWTVRRDFMVKRCLWTEDMKTVMYSYLWGQLYNGIFLFPKMKGANYLYLKRILSIPEIKELTQYKELISCSTWIKNAILCRFAWMFYLYFKIKAWTSVS